MAATKKEAGVEKEKKLTPEESAKLVLDYLRKTNRPYSATDISNNLKNRVTKAAATKLLKDMHERKEIDGKVAGKAAVYHALQEEVEEDFFSNIAAMEEQTKTLREQTAALKSEEKDLRQSLRGGTSIASTPDLKQSIASLEKEKASLETHLTKLRAGDAKPVSAMEKAKILKNYKKMQKCVSARKKIRKELWGYISDAMGLSKERKVEMLEELGLEHMIG